MMADQTRAGRHKKNIAMLGRLRVEVAVPTEDGGETLLRGIRRTRAHVVHLWPLPDMFSAQADIVISELTDDLADRLPWTIGDPQAALLVVLSTDAAPDLGRLEGVAPHGILLRPMAEAPVPAALIAAYSQHRYESRLRARTAKLENTVRNMQLVEQAKRILMDSRAMSERDAYQFMRERAMSQRTPLWQIAKTVIDAQSIM